MYMTTTMASRPLEDRLRRGTTHSRTMGNAATIVTRTNTTVVVLRRSTTHAAAHATSHATAHSTAITSTHSTTHSTPCASSESPFCRYATAWCCTSTMRCIVWGGTWRGRCHTIS